MASNTAEEVKDARTTKATYDNIEEILKNDPCVKVAGCDIDGVLRGKLMNKKKFLGIVKDGFGYCPQQPFNKVARLSR